MDRTNPLLPIFKINLDLGEYLTPVFKFHFRVNLFFSSKIEKYQSLLLFQYTSLVEGKTNRKCKESRVLYIDKIYVVIVIVIYAYIID